MSIGEIKTQKRSILLRKVSRTKIDQETKRKALVDHYAKLLWCEGHIS